MILKRRQYTFHGINKGIRPKNKNMVLTALPVLAYAAVSGIVRAYPSITAYVLTTTTYEMLRTLPRIRNAHWLAKSFRNGFEGPDVPLLITEKVAAGVFCSLQGMLVAPVHLVQDVKWLELRARGLDPLLYGYTKEDVQGGNTYKDYLSIVTNEPQRNSNRDSAGERRE